MQKVKTVFIGTADFGIPSLETLFNLEFIDVVAVVTQPDRPAGRKQELQPSPVKQWMVQHQPEIPLEQPEKIKDVAHDFLKKYQPELIIVAAYGQIIPSSILDYPKYQCLNLHGSLLPQLRGAVPVHMAILQGFETTGVTLQRMVSKMDKGPIIQTSEIRLQQTETAEDLMDKLAQLAAGLVEDEIENWVNGELEEVEQNYEEATYCYMSNIAKEKAEITAETSVVLAERMVRAFYPWPVAWMLLENGKRLKIFASKIHQQSKNQNIKNVKKTVLFSEDKKLFLQLKDGVLELEEVQLEGKQRGSGEEYLYLVE